MEYSSTPRKTGLSLGADAVVRAGGVEYAHGGHDEVVEIMNVMEGEDRILVNRCRLHDLDAGQVMQVVRAARIKEEPRAGRDERMVFLDGEFLESGRIDDDGARLGQHSLAFPVVRRFNQSRGRRHGRDDVGEVRRFGTPARSSSSSSSLPSRRASRNPTL